MTQVHKEPALQEVPRRPAGDNTRKDIQALRAVAVGMVILGVLWHHRLPGGRIGVDVFFVISGFLITSHLIKHPPAKWADFTEFWGRRIRRLLPAAATVLAAILLAAKAWLPDPQVSRTTMEAAAASIYGENWAKVWVLADPIRAAEPDSPVQHYWSLSVEEQFYFLWPLLIGGTVLLGSKRGRDLLIPVVGAVVGLSFIMSVITTQTNESLGYFGTHVRMWQLGAGALLAIAGRRGSFSGRAQHARAALSWVGMGIIGLGGVYLTYDYPFPGPFGLVPVIGTVLVIAADSDDTSWGVGRLMGIWPIQYTGDISYSLYLWHLPVIAIAPYAMGITASDLTVVHRVLLLGVTFALGSLTRELVEEKLRYKRGIVRTVPRSFAMGAVCIVSILILAAVIRATL